AAFRLAAGRPPPPVSALSLHDALPIFVDLAAAHLELDRELLIDLLSEEDVAARLRQLLPRLEHERQVVEVRASLREELDQSQDRSEEHTSELQSRENLVCRLLLEKKNH